LDDSEILQRFRARDEGAFDTVFRTYYAQLVGIGVGLLGERAAAEDVAQDVLLELWRRRENIVLETSLRAYLIRATRNRALNHLRHERVARAADPEALERVEAPVGDRDLVEQEMDAAVRRTVSELPARCREVFELSRVHGLPYAEIAQVLQISIKTVEAQMGKALRALREGLAPWIKDDGGI
jgi:RNA polymerase sigma-70 factor (ECF subfamily)